METLRRLVKVSGERFPKKHGEWYRLHIYDDHYLVLDTWNKAVYHHKGKCQPSDTNNMYHVVYIFNGKQGVVKQNMVNFWKAHILMN